MSSFKGFQRFYKPGKWANNTPKFVRICCRIFDWEYIDKRIAHQTTAMMTPTAKATVTAIATTKNINLITLMMLTRNVYFGEYSFTLSFTKSIQFENDNIQMTDGKWHNITSKMTSKSRSINLSSFQLCHNNKNRKRDSYNNNNDNNNNNISSNMCAYFMTRTNAFNSSSFTIFFSHLGYSEQVRQIFYFIIIW